WTVIMGEPMANRVAMVITCQEDKMEYETRIRIIEDARVLLRKLTKQLSMSYQLGIGSVKPIEELSQSYQEALEALRNSVGKVTHVEDIPTVCTYEDNYPIQLETALFASVEKGNIRAVKEYGSQFFDWMEETASEEIDSIRLKVIEFVLWAEHFAFESGSMKTYHFCDRKSYLKELLQCAGLKELKIWFMDKMEMATKNIEKKKENQANGVVEQAKNYIRQNYCKDVSLDTVSCAVKVSPYYFSKLFKEQTGENFVEYVTNIRMEQAKKMLLNPEYSIKEVCTGAGYSDPNYFSRIFKKCSGVTPSEYREGGTSHEL
ncbi:MAG: helix-turn-helix domain-containing protein, partial [Lachnospiraceae bacterium]